jgi:hypothetical protein
MAGVMHFHALRKKPLSPTLPATREGGPSGLRFHAGTKTVLAFPGALGSL